MLYCHIVDTSCTIMQSGRKWSEECEGNRCWHQQADESADCRDWWSGEVGAEDQDESARSAFEGSDADRRNQPGNSHSSVSKWKKVKLKLKLRHWNG